VGFNNPDWTWSELEAALSDRSDGTDPWERGDPRARGLGGAQKTRRDGRASGSPSWNAGGDGPAWSRKRQPFEAPASSPDGVPGSGSVPYAELHCHSNFSFLDGASHPEELVTEAARLGLEALALTDHNGFYGVVRFA
jgi:error-prone DNA polymerase